MVLVLHNSLEFILIASMLEQVKTYHNLQDIEILKWCKLEEMAKLINEIP